MRIIFSTFIFLMINLHSQVEDSEDFDIDNRAALAQVLRTRKPFQVGTVSGTTTGRFETFGGFRMENFTGVFSVGEKTGRSFIKENTRKEKNTVYFLIGVKV